jgi:spoIIIJ-associated protein
MKTYEAPTIAEACQKAASDNNCTVSDLEYKIIQYPKKGIFGLFSKNAIIDIINIKKAKIKDEKKEDKTIPKEPEEISEIQKEKIETKDNTKQVKKIIPPKEQDKKTDEIVNSFFEQEKKAKGEKKETITAKELEEQIKKLFSFSCFDIDTIEVDIEDNTAFIFIDGEDAALLIGKEGYRYNALSYMLFNWINIKYGLYLKLEIAQFLASQQDMIKNLMKPVVEHVENVGNGKTKPLNGILVQIALEYLRDVFPNKYVAIKKNKDGQRYIIINDFNKR